MSGQAKQQPKTDLQQVAQRAGCPLQKLEAPEEVRGAEKPKEITQNRFTTSCAAGRVPAAKA